jgi:hypothetical protein
MGDEAIRKAYRRYGSAADPIRAEKPAANPKERLAQIRRMLKWNKLAISGR